MPETTVLELQLAGSAPRPVPGEGSWNLHRGGRDVLLRWLETQLGLQAASVSHATRVLEFVAALERCAGASFAQSLC